MDVCISIESKDGNLSQGDRERTVTRVKRIREGKKGGCCPVCKRERGREKKVLLMRGVMKEEREG